MKDRHRKIKAKNILIYNEKRQKMQDLMHIKQENNSVTVNNRLSTLKVTRSNRQLSNNFML